MIVQLRHCNGANEYQRSQIPAIDNHGHQHKGCNATKFSQPLTSQDAVLPGFADAYDAGDAS
jgi:hypothetical protein